MSLTPTNHLADDAAAGPDAELTKEQAKETALYEAQEKYGANVGPSNLQDVSAPSHSNADGQIEVDVPNTTATPQIQYHD